MSTNDITRVPNLRVPAKSSAAVYRLPGKGYNRLGESDAEPCTTSPFHLDLATPNKVNRGELGTRSAGDLLHDQ